MDSGSYLAHLRRESGAFEACLAGDLSAPVEHCGEWTLYDLADHLGQGNMWAAMAVAEKHGDYEGPAAPARLSELRNPERLRAWLFAVARNECHSRLRVGLSPPSARPPETMESLKKFAAKHTETRDLVRAALVGLKPAEREALDLNLRHEFEIGRAHV